MKQASCKSLCVSFTGQLDAEEEQPSPDTEPSSARQDRSPSLHPLPAQIPNAPADKTALFLIRAAKALIHLGLCRKNAIGQLRARETPREECEGGGMVQTCNGRSLKDKRRFRSPLCRLFHQYLSNTVSFLCV